MRIHGTSQGMVQNTQAFNPYLSNPNLLTVILQGGACWAQNLVSNLNQLNVSKQWIVFLNVLNTVTIYLDNTLDCNLYLHKHTDFHNQTTLMFKGFHMFEAERMDCCSTFALQP